MAPFQTGSVLHLLSSRSGGRTVLLNLSEQRSGHVDGSSDSGIIARKKKKNERGIYSGVKANVCSGSVPAIQIHKLHLVSFVFILLLTFFTMQAPPWPQCYLQSRDRCPSYKDGSFSVSTTAGSVINHIHEWPSVLCERPVNLSLRKLQHPHGNTHWTKTSSTD